MQVSDAEQLWTAAAQMLRAQVSEAVGSRPSKMSSPSTATRRCCASAPRTATCATASCRATCRWCATRSTRSAQRTANSSSRCRSPTPSRAGRSIEHGIADTAESELEQTTSGHDSGTARRQLERHAGMNPRYTFDAFVIGASNRFAHAAALRVAETPARSLQPAVHLRRRRAGQDPPAARHRPLRPAALPARPRALRLAPRRS